MRRSPGCRSLRGPTDVEGRGLTTRARQWDNGPMTRAELIHRIAQKQFQIVGRDPGIGTPVSLPAGYAVCFKPGMKLRERVDARIPGRLKRSRTRADQRIRTCPPASDLRSTTVMRIDALLQENCLPGATAGSLDRPLRASSRPRTVRRCSRMRIDRDMGQPQRRQSGGGLVVEDASEQRRRFVFATVGIGVAIVVAGADTAA